MSLIDIQLVIICSLNFQQMPEVNSKDNNATFFEEVLVSLVLTLNTFNMMVCYFVVTFKQVLGWREW